MKKICVAVAVAAGMAWSGVASAQVRTPTFMPPREGNTVGIYVSDFKGLTLEGIWRRSGGGYDLGLRAGVVDTEPDLSLTVGGEVRSPIALAGAPIGLAFTVGGQLIVGESNGLGAQAGFTAGHTFVGEGLTFTPYLHPRLAIFGDLDDDDAAGDDDLDLDVLADIGFDVGFQPNLLLRFGAALSAEGADWGFGVAWRTR